MDKPASNHQFIPDLVTIIVPVYNAEQYLDVCLQSIINQTYADFEAILVDDGSTDGSGQLCDAYATRDSRIKVFHQQNGGPAAARNIGLENSTGGFIFFADADDFLEENALELLIKAYQQYDADLVVGEFNRIKNGDSGYGDNGIFSQSGPLLKQDIMDYTRNYLRKPNRFPLFAYSWGRLFKSSIIRNNNLVFNADLRTFEDVAFNFDYLIHVNKASLIKRAVYNHLVHENYLSAGMKISDNPQSLFGYQGAIAAIGRFLERSDSVAGAKKDVGHAYVSLTIIQLVRTCGQMNDKNKRAIYKLINQTVSDPALRDSLQFYTPAKGESKIIPILMKLKLVWPIIWVCKYKAYKRYGTRK